jgi:modification methylase
MIKLILGDCREKIKELEDVQLFVTSPPYAQNKEYEEGLTWDGLYDLIKVVAEESIKVCRDSGFFFVNAGETTKYFRSMLDLYNETFRNAGWIAHSRRIWAKEFARCTLTGAMTAHTIPSAEWEYLLTFRKPPNDKEVMRNKKLSLRGIWNAQGTAKYGDHPSTFPPDLARKAILVWSDIGDLVVDPFAGTSSTGIACIDEDRNYIGIEQNEHYHQMAVERLEKAEKNKQPRLLDIGE